MVVYLDLMFLLNFVIDFVLLRLTVYFSRRTVSKRRILIGAFIGACYTVFLFFPPLSILYTFVVKLLFSMFIIYVVFGFHHIRAFIRNLMLFYFVSFVIGGGIFALHYFLQSNVEIMSGVAMVQTQGVIHPITISLLVIGIPVVVWLAKSSYKVIGNSKRISHFMAKVILYINNKQVECQGLIDTGNKLYEPITRIPVMIMEYHQLQDILPDTLIEKIKKKDSMIDNHNFFEEIDDEWATKIRMVPFRGVAKKMDFLLAIRPDKALIEVNNQTYATDKILVGINPEKLASHGDYQAIIHPDFITEDNIVSSSQTYKQAEEV